MKYKIESVNLARELNQMLSNIATKKDPGLSASGIVEAQAIETKALQQEIFERARDLRTRAEARAFMARLDANKSRPRTKIEPGALIYSQQKWDQARSLLESGRNVYSLIANADIDTVLAIEEFAPTYLQAKTALRTDINAAIEGHADSAPNLRIYVERRIAELMPGTVADALATALDAEEDLAAAMPYIDHLSEFGERGSSSQSLMDLAVQAHYAEPVAQAVEAGAST